MERERIASFSIAAAFFIAAVLSGYAGYRSAVAGAKPPEPVRLTRAIFAQAEMLPSAQVKPGTFLIKLPSVEEFLRLQEHSVLKPIITFGYDWADDKYVVSYWLSRAGGDGVFYHATEEIKKPWWWFQYGSVLEREGDTLFIKPAPYVLPTTLWTLAAVLGVVGVLIGVGATQRNFGN